MPESSKRKNASELFTVIGEKNRLKIIRLCLAEECSVQTLLDETGLEKTLLSKHLKVLRDSGILHSQRHGRNVKYSLNDKICHEKLKNTLSLHCCNVELKA